MKRFFTRKKKIAGPNWWQHYEGLDWHTPRRRTPVAELRYVVLDTEATGTDPRTDRLLSVSAIRIINGEMRIGEVLELLVQQASFTDGASIPIHGIKPEDSSGGVTEADAIRQVVDFVGDAVIVGHHIGFDIRLLNEGLGRLGLGELHNARLDTARLAVRAEHLFPNNYIQPEQYTLDALCARYNVRPRYRHTASGDAFITGIIFLKLLAKLAARGATTWGKVR